MANYSIIRPENRESWLEFRKSGIGSSEIGSLMGIGYDTVIDLYRKKKGLVPPTVENDIMRAGHEFEPMVALKYAEATGDIMDPTSEGDWIAMDNERTYLRVSPDRIFWNKEIPENERTYDNAYILECKTSGKNLSPNSYPDSWYYQVQYQMGVMGIKKAVIAWICYYGHLHFGYVEVDFNKVIYQNIVETATEFWCEHVMKNIVPDIVMNSTDASFRWPVANPETIAVANEGMTSLVAEYYKLEPQKKELEDRMEEIKQAIRVAMGEHEELKTTDGTTLATWKNTKVSEKFDANKFEAEHPDIYKEYLSPVSSRRLMIRKVATA